MSPTGDLPACMHSQRLPDDILISIVEELEKQDDCQSSRAYSLQSPRLLPFSDDNIPILRVPKAVSSPGALCSKRPFHGTHLFTSVSNFGLEVHEEGESWLNLPSYLREAVLEMDAPAGNLDRARPYFLDALAKKIDFGCVQMLTLGLDADDSLEAFWNRVQFSRKSPRNLKFVISFKAIFHLKFLFDQVGIEQAITPLTLSTLTRLRTIVFAFSVDISMNTHDNIIPPWCLLLQTAPTTIQAVNISVDLYPGTSREVRRWIGPDADGYPPFLSEFDSILSDSQILSQQTQVELKVTLPESECDSEEHETDSDCDDAGEDDMTSAEVEWSLKKIFKQTRKRLPLRIVLLEGP
ncbi:unnamed protein product [Cyclocybe aegerita]|uniref:Uncharacterized protein n=1 Tax=Cyclocybe aegerita TaxID=1973307 RepID=A0A8S0WCQ0_CYCAE|nr:unnamed protein product [Cyclocybe aegerita]